MGSLGNVIISGDNRDAQKKYWAEHSSQATVEAMLLDSQAADIDKEERPEVNALLTALMRCLRGGGCSQARAALQPILGR
jgi:hypothetical protein